MKRFTRRAINVTVLSLLVLLLAVGAAYADSPPVRTYQVTITNLTAAGQPLTPPLVATHRPATDIFTVGDPASFELKEVAENGNLEPLAVALSEDKHVSDVVIAPAGTPPPVLPGTSVTFEITGSKGTKHLSWVSMLICTNDGFTGVDTLRLPQHVGDTVTAHTDAYDAGTEINTEDFADMVPPCQALTGVSSDDPGTGMSDPALAQGGVIHHHEGIQGIADLIPDIHGWTNPVAQIEITRVD